MAEAPAFLYRANATDSGGREVTTEFTSNVDYRPGDELPLRSARWEVESVGPAVVVRVNGVEQTVRAIRCVIR